MKTIRAIYKGGVFYPLDPVDLPENSAATIAADDGAPFVPVHAMNGRGLMRFIGTLPKWPEDPVAWQHRQRDEDWS